MITNGSQFKNIDEYINQFPGEIQVLLQSMRQTIKKAAPKAEEAIKYQMPTFTLNGNLVHFAAYKNHIGFYPTPSGIEAFKNEFSTYKFSKGAVQFPIDEKLPLSLVSRIVKYRVEESTEKAKLKNVKVCPNGHRFIKTSDCPTCPICEKERKPTYGFKSLLAAPAIRALESKKISTLKQLSKYSESEILKLHGMGKNAITTLKKAMKTEGLAFKKR
ncbi:MAG: hypothetical protein C4539_11200 [Ignavibacteriales bacterium]|nr:MAG: hypothetical protein C4539_11200 [Ignavibacteriales bacterium]